MDITVSYHEAGHAVAARAKNLPIKKCSVVAAGRSDGFVKLARPLRDLDTRAVLLFLLAGPAAERRYTRQVSCQGHDDRDRADARLVASLIARADEDAPATDAVVQRFDVMAGALVELHWPQIQKTAEWLIGYRELSGVELQFLLQE